MPDPNQQQVPLDDVDRKKPTFERMPMTKEQLEEQGNDLQYEINKIRNEEKNNEKTDTSLCL